MWLQLLLPSPDGASAKDIENTKDTHGLFCIPFQTPTFKLSLSQSHIHAFHTVTFTLSLLLLVVLISPIYRCKQCSYTCTENAHSKKHMFKHSGEKPFVSKQCKYSCCRSSCTASRQKESCRTSYPMKIHLKQHSDKQFK